MVQSIYNTYQPQYNFNYPNNVSRLPVYQMPVNPFVPNGDVFQPTVTYQPPIPRQHIPLTPGYYFPAVTTPDFSTIAQQVYSVPYYQHAIYRSEPVQEVPKVDNTPKPVTVDVCPWVTDPEIKMAMSKLSEITHTPEDIAYLSSIGVNPPFKNGKEALDVIAKNQTKVEFEDLGDSLAHAQYINDENRIVINQKYKGKMTLPMALAIADAIYHEAGHAKDRDDQASVQEELDCLSLNTLGYRYQQKVYPEIMNANDQSRLLSDGVALYPKLFFDQDPSKAALINRVKEKYGFLPLSSPNHDGARQPLANIIKQQYQATQGNTTPVA